MANRQASGCSITAGGFCSSEKDCTGRLAAFHVFLQSCPQRVLKTAKMSLPVHLSRAQFAIYLKRTKPRAGSASRSPHNALCGAFEGGARTRSALSPQPNAGPLWAKPTEGLSRFSNLTSLGYFSHKNRFRQHCQKRERSKERESKHMVNNPIPTMIIAAPNKNESISPLFTGTKNKHNSAAIKTIGKTDISDSFIFAEITPGCRITFPLWFFSIIIPHSTP